MQNFDDSRVQVDRLSALPYQGSPGQSKVLR